LPHAPLLPIVVTGDRAAIRECIERYGGLVWSLVRRASLGHDEAISTVQDVFADLWRSAPRFDPAVTSETTFVAMIARRRLVDQRRRRERRPATTPHLELQRAPFQMPAPELGPNAAEAAHAIDRLAPEQRQVLILSACQGLSLEEIAHTTGMPLPTVKAHARRALMRIHESAGAKFAETVDAVMGRPR
jgi:RNA polymerase sigma-70 factor (ECF subfamily)